MKKGLAKLITITFVAIVLTACGDWDNDTIKEGITNYYTQGNKKAGGGNTVISEIKVLDKIVVGDTCLATAVVKGYYKNHSMPTPIEEDMLDTLSFVIILPESPTVIKVRRVYQSK